jgi:hypothetical protein
MEPSKFTHANSEFIVEKEYLHNAITKKVSVKLEINYSLKNFSIKPTIGYSKEFRFIVRNIDHVNYIVAISRAIEEAVVFAEKLLNEDRTN